MTRFGVIGAGAVGSTIAGRLSAAGHQVALFARGDHLAMLADRGIVIMTGADRVRARPTMVESGAAHFCDTLFVAVKADALPSTLPAITAASHEGTYIVPLCNGIPWWYHQRNTRDCGRTVAAVDPDGRLAAHIRSERIIGAVVFLRVALEGPGLVRSQGGERLSIGMIDGAASEPAQLLATALSAAGIATEVAPAIRRILWSKVALNLATNPLSVVTGATLVAMCDDPALRSVVSTIIAETLGIAAAEGESPPHDVDALIEITHRAGPFMTSMAQDQAAGRPLELASIADAVFELADRHDLAMPSARAITALARYRSGS